MKSMINTKTIVKLFGITGAMCLSCVCPTSKAVPGTMTLEELKAFLKEQKDETERSRTRIDKEIKEINAIGAGDAKCQRRVEEVSKENKKSGVRSITYNYYGVPCAIETIGQTAGIDLYNAINPTDARYKYMTERVAALSSNLNTISEKLTVEELKKLETPDEDRLLDGFVIRRITFDTILLSDFFDESSCTKGKEWYSDRKKLEEAIDAYAENVTILKYLPIRHIGYNNPILQFAYDEVSEKMTVRPTFGKSTWGTPDHFIYKLSGDPLGWKRELLKETLKGMLKYKNGKEKVILLLLLDKITPSEYRLEWVDGCWAQYLQNINRITLNFDSERDRRFLSHEIGHYLQVHLGLRQTFKDYESAFAKKLLLLKAPFENDDKAFSVPEALRSLFANFEKNVPHALTRSDLFMRWQLASRWNHPAEISNILGIYFEQNTIYTCALSDICEQKCIRYGHAYRGGVYRNGNGACKVRNGNHKDIFEDLVRKASELKPDPKALELLCKLHGIPFGKVVDSFEAKSEEEFNELETSYNVFRSSDF